MTTQSIPTEVQPFLYMNGFILSNNSTTPNSILNLSNGQCRDSNDLMDVILSSPVTINMGINGVNGLDQGSLVASQVYAVWAIADSTNYRPTAALASLASNSNPLMPFGYDSSRLVGYFFTDGSSNIRKYYCSGTSNDRKVIFDTVVGILATGNSTVIVNVSLSFICPAISGVVAELQMSFVPNVAGDGVTLAATTASSGTIFLFGQVATVRVASTETMPVTLVSGVPNIAYKVSSSSDAVDIKVVSLNFSV